MKKLFLFLVLLGYSITSAQVQKPLLDYDYARFNYDENSSFLEIYYSFAEYLLKPTNIDGVQFVKGYLKINIKNVSDDSLIVDREYKFKSVASDSLTNGKNKSLIGTLAFVVPFGDYTCIITGGDESSSLKYEDKFSFHVSKAKTPSFFLSDIQLASSIKQGSVDPNSVFYKNSYEVIPNPSTVYGEGLPVVFFYSELYDLNKDVQSEYLKVDQLLLDVRNNPVIKKSKLIGRKNPSIVEAGALNISKIPSGTYTLALVLTDSVQNLSLASSKKIFIYNPSIPQPLAQSFSDNDYIASEFASMGDEELDEVFEVSKYLAKKTEIQQWSGIIDLESKRNFLFTFWKGRDQEPSTPLNEYKRDYFKRVELANAQFSTFQKRGYKTDRGRVYLLYGEPSEIERYPNQIDSKPYEIWQYNSLEGGVQFVFADLTGFSDYLLLHSTLRGELRDDNWQRKVVSN
ncbi:MAG TPA: GWxTD domain-containing protein [Ignavibacteriaceae bacterium]|nr:GWxTD domain-containing protein [Ignavibacteriaceae bacterium]